MEQQRDADRWTTEARVKLPGIDVITLGEHGLRSVEGYFDQRTLLEQLGV